MSKVVVFHKGRGGRFNNEGYLTCKDVLDRFTADYYGINVYFSFENITPDLIDQLEELGEDITQMASSWDQESKNRFNALNLLDHDGNSITADSLGDAVIIDESGNSTSCTVEEYESNSGLLDIDGDYDTYIWKPVSEMNENETEVMLRDLKPYEYEELLFENGVDQDVFKIIKSSSNMKNWVFDIFNKTSFEAFCSFPGVIVFDCVEDAEEEGFKGPVEVRGKYYVVY